MKQLFFMLLCFPIFIFGQENISKQTFYKNKKIKENFYVLKKTDKIKHGNYTKYFTNGKVNEEGAYNIGQKDGDWMVYFSNGNIQKFGNYSDNLKVGLWYYFAYDGTIKKIYNHSLGKEIQIDLDTYPPLKYYITSYPSLALENGIEGEVIISFEIDSTCNCTNLIIENSTDSVFNKSSLDMGREMIKKIEKKKNLSAIIESLLFL